MNQDQNNLSAAIEALLFIYGEPVEIKKIARTLKVEDLEVEEALKNLWEDAAREERGIFLIRKEDSVQLVTKPQFADLMQTIIKEDMQENLTPAALETLSIVAYAGPISRSEIEYIRGVNSSFTLRNLLLRGLVERMPDARRANAYVYKPSMDFLAHLGLSKIDDLPEFPKFREIVNQLWKKEVEPENKEIPKP